MFYLKRIIIFFILLICIIGIAFSLSFKNKKSDNLKHIKVAEVTHSIFYAPQYLADALGYFEDEGLDVDVLPGPSAVIPAVLLSGITPQPFAFMGFPPDKSSEREKFFRDIQDIACTMCFYVSPHKAEKHIAGMLEVFGNRRAALVREISKVFQESIRGNLAGILERVREGVKGELVLIVEGYTKGDDTSWRNEALEMFNDGQSVKDIVNRLEGRAGRNEIKRFLLEQKTS